MSATHTSERIKKLIEKGLAPESIAKKIGRPGDTERVFDEAQRMNKIWVGDQWGTLSVEVGT